MVNQQTLLGNWNEIKGKIRSRWGQLTDDELEQAHGNLDQLIGTIQQRTGAAREEIGTFLEELTQTSPEMSESHGGRHYARDVATRAQEATRRAGAGARQGLHQAQEFVQHRPMQSLGACFAIGLATGLLVSMLMHRR